ncbi:MAG: large conductance mechanosensitive channel protein MscL [Myxococcales bacterium]|jgi:large conductance mechanosensitive channel|nr:large conductance mechanosensitive channel protein MscL [Myxococcales bacterium]
MLKGFRDFVTRGNVIDLAVGVIIGSLFGQIVTALVEKVINPLIAALVGQPNFDDVLRFTVNGAQIQIGAVITVAVHFLLTAAAVYVFIVYPINKLNAKRAIPPSSEEVALLTEIRDLLKAKDGRET